jgi:hypothetical protein
VNVADPDDKLKFVGHLSNPLKLVFQIATNLT